MCPSVEWCPMVCLLWLWFECGFHEHRRPLGLFSTTIPLFLYAAPPAHSTASFREQKNRPSWIQNVYFGWAISSLLLKKTLWDPDLWILPIPSRKGLSHWTLPPPHPDTGFQITKGSRLVISDFQSKLSIIFPMMHRLQRTHDEDGSGSDGWDQGGKSDPLSQWFEVNEFFWQLYSSFGQAWVNLLRKGWNHSRSYWRDREEDVNAGSGSGEEERKDTDKQAQQILDSQKRCCILAAVVWNGPAEIRATSALVIFLCVYIFMLSFGILWRHLSI